ncbi:MAG: T9SS type A sorting domain-containing protein [Bacteroidia bacterium]
MKFSLSLLLVFLSSLLNAQVGKLLWEDQFNSLDNWHAEIGNGSWGWGNGELQFYKEENLSVVDVAGEAGNKALKITAKKESGAGITDQWGNPLQYTSGKVSTMAKVAVQYGMVEVRLQIPDLDLGGWPAFWMLGTTNLGWPGKGELDIMEMGHSKNFRNLHDTHNGGSGKDNSTVNQMIAANAIFYSESSINNNNPTGAASIAYDPDDEYCRPYYNQEKGLVNRFITCRMYWDKDSIRFTIIDDEKEMDLYDTPFHIDEESSEFHEPFYIIANLAIGGALTDAYNLGDPGSGAAVSMNMPAEMLIDYVKVYEWNGQGKVTLGPPKAKGGDFGIYTDETEVDDKLIPGEDAEVYVWEGTLDEGSIAPFEGENGLSWKSNGKGWFGAGVMSMQPTNLLNFGDGYLSFRIKAPASLSFQIGIIDAWGNQNYIEFPANQTKYGLERNGEWGQAKIPVTDIRGEFIDLRMLSYEFVILETNGAGAEFAIDDIVWEGGSPVGIPKNSINSNVSVYPNPTSATAQLHVNLPKTEMVTIAIYNINGKKVMDLYNGTLEKGTQILDIEVSNLNDGLYFIRLDQNSGISTTKLLLQR